MEIGFDCDFGARSLYRAVRTTLLPPLAEVLREYESGGPRDIDVVVALTGEITCHRRDQVDHPAEEESTRTSVRS